jgi:hypothetical protein
MPWVISEKNWMGMFINSVMKKSHFTNVTGQLS